MAFSGLRSAFDEMESKLIGDKYLYWKHINKVNTILFIIPLLGQGCLKSDAEIKVFGDEIATILGKFKPK